MKNLPKGPVAVAVSGGVDSLCALLLCVRAGHDTVALHARLYDPADAVTRIDQQNTEERLAYACSRMGVPLHVTDLREHFAACVSQPFALAWAGGLTPNPCTSCNRHVKFDAFMESAKALGCTALVTGHYASLCHDHPYASPFPLPGPAADMRKDQSYFLGLVPGRNFSRVAFPLAGLEKSAARAMVAAAGIEVPQPKESQDVCFIPPSGQGYRDVLVRLLPELAAASQDGDIVEMDSGRVIGRHHGLWRYTEGQRRGLGIAWSEPLYVVGKRAADNTLLVGPVSRTLITHTVLTDVNFLIPPEDMPAVCLARLRYRQNPTPARVSVSGRTMHLDFTMPVSLSAPGQTGVILDLERRVLAAGTIVTSQ